MIGTLKQRKKMIELKFRIRLRTTRQKTIKEKEIVTQFEMSQQTLSDHV